MFSNNFAHGFKSCWMSSTLGADKDSVLCKTVMDDLKYNHNGDNAYEIHKRCFKNWVIRNGNGEKQCLYVV